MNLFHYWLHYKYSKLPIYFWENFQVRKMQKNVEICKRDQIKWPEMEQPQSELQTNRKELKNFS